MSAIGLMRSNDRCWEISAVSDRERAMHKLSIQFFGLNSRIGRCGLRPFDKGRARAFELVIDEGGDGRG